MHLNLLTPESSQKKGYKKIIPFFSFGLLFISFTACSPSPRLVELGRYYFEVCNRLDHQPNTNPEKKIECWQKWLRHYPKGQPIEKLLYAEKRETDLATGYTIPIEEEMISITPSELPIDENKSLPNDILDNPCKMICEKNLDQCKVKCEKEPQKERCQDYCANENSVCLTACF